MKKLLIIVRDRLNTEINYTPFWDYIKSIDPKYSHCIDYVILVDTDKSIEEIKNNLLNLYNPRLQFIIVDVTDSDRDGWCAMSFWDKWRKK